MTLFYIMIEHLLFILDYMFYYSFHTMLWIVLFFIHAIKTQPAFQFLFTGESMINVESCLEFVIICIIAILFQHISLVKILILIYK